MRVLGLGDCCVDYYIDEQMAYPGGNAFNVALFAGENGAEAAFLGTISDDELGMHLISVAKKKGIDISHAPVKKGILGRAAVRIIDGNRVFDSDFFVIVMIAITRNYSVIRILYVYLFIQHNQIIKQADTFVSAHSDLVTAGGLFLFLTQVSYCEQKPLNHL